MPVKPELGGGFNDYLPADAIIRQNVFTTIRQVFERYGFQPLETPGVEREEVLTGGDPNFSKMIFRIAESGDQPLALRFDLTVPLARVVAANPDIPKPFKRYQVGSVWRGEKPQAGRYREFTQFDADIVGSSSMMADAEVVAIMNDTIESLGFTRFMVRVNNRKILNGLASYAGFSETKLEGVLRAIDKMDRDGWEGVSQHLAEVPENEYHETALALSEVQIDRIKAFLDIRAEGKEELLDRVSTLMSNSAVALEGVAELRQMLRFIQSLGVPEDRWIIDLSVARGLGYYTGPVFETILSDLRQIGSVFSGGRYDGLVQMFSTQPMPATGASVGVDRLFAAMRELKLLPESISVTQVLILVLDKQYLTEYGTLATLLREGGVRTEVYLGSEKNIKGQLAYALKSGVPLALIAGSNEFSQGVIQVKDLRKRSQTAVQRAEVLSFVRQTLSLA